MKIFAVYGKIKLSKKPVWLDAYRKKYKSNYEFHVTLKQPCLIIKKQIPLIVYKFSHFINSFVVPKRRIQLRFQRLVVDRDDGTIMINADHNTTILKLHSQILKTLRGFNSYISPNSRKWETHFHPHLTIVSDLNKKLFNQALKELKKTYLCEGYVQEIVLSVIEKRTLQSRTQSKFTKTFRL